MSQMMLRCLRFSSGRSCGGIVGVLKKEYWHQTTVGWEVWVLVLFFLRKISPELTCTANPPLFAEEDWPWANIRAHLPLLYMWDAYRSMACQAVPCPHQGSEPANPGLPEVERVHLTTVPLGWPPTFSYFYNKKVSSWVREPCLPCSTLCP